MEEGMKKYSRQEREEHLENWKNGSLPKAGYAKSVGLKVTTFYKWAQRTEKPKQSFVEIDPGKIISPVRKIIIEKGSFTIHIPMSTSKDEIQTVFYALEGIQ